MANVHAFGAKGDGSTDDTAALQHAIERGDGIVEFPRGDYLIHKPLVVPLDKVGRLAFAGSLGTARLILRGSGPALHLVGTHRRTAQPDEFAEGVWLKERMPTVSGLEIVGADPQADGIRIEGAMQPTLTGLLIRRCRHGIHLVHRNRNLLISHCHVYDNSGVGIFLDRVNLHQVIVQGSHISYCRQGGVKIAGGEVRNVQITGNDIEYNYDPSVESVADVLFDAREGTIREGTISGNTIQARESPHGANLRLLGVGQGQPNAVGMLAIAGNLLGSQSTILHFHACRGVTVTGNVLYSGYQYALVAEDCEHLVLGPNSVDYNSDYRGPSTDAVMIKRCRNVLLEQTIFQHTLPAAQPVPASLRIEDSENIHVHGCQILRPRRCGIEVRNCRCVRIAGCTIRGGGDDPEYRWAIRVLDSSRVQIVHNFLDPGSEGTFLLPPEAGTAHGNG